MTARSLCFFLLLAVGTTQMAGGQLINLSKGLVNLPQGFDYRDPETMSASEAVASFAKGFQRDADAQAEINMVAGRYQPDQPPKFLSSVRVIPGGLEQRDEEIFDFVDSRFLSPEPDHIRNVPLDEVERERDSLLAASRGPSNGGGIAVGGIYPGSGSAFNVFAPSNSPPHPPAANHENFYHGTGSSFSFQSSSAAAASVGPFADRTVGAPHPGGSLGSVPHHSSLPSFSFSSLSSPTPLALHSVSSPNTFPTSHATFPASPRTLPASPHVASSLGGLPRLAPKPLAPVTALPQPHHHRPQHLGSGGQQHLFGTPAPRLLEPTRSFLGGSHSLGGHGIYGGSVEPRLVGQQPDLVHHNRLPTSGSGNYQSFTFNHNKIL